jgi:arylsulfatase
MAVYAAQIHRMDQGVGRIMAALRKFDIDEDTAVMFLSDNGGCAEFMAEDGYVARTQIWPMRNGRSPRVGNFTDTLPGSESTYMSYDLPWANASNTPFRLYKHWVHEGGIATPFIVHYPARIKMHRLVHQPAHIIDIAATCFDMAGADYPADYNGKPIHPLEGESLMPALEGEHWSRQKPILWEHEGKCAIRAGDWKMVKKYPGNWELYNMERDRTELHDLISKNTPKAKELEKFFDEWVEHCEILPWETLSEYYPWGRK